MIFNYREKQVEFEFNGVKCIQTNNCNLVCRSIIDAIKNNEIVDDNYKFSKNALVYLDCFSKTKNFINLNKNSSFTIYLLDLIKNDKAIVNETVIQKIVALVNNQFETEILSQTYDVERLISLIFDVEDLGYLTKDVFLKLLKMNFWSNKTTFLINDLDWLKLNDVLPYLNMHTFIFVTSDFRKNVNNLTQFEAIVFMDENNVFDVLDKDKFIAFLELKTNFEINNVILDSFIKGEKSWQNSKISTVLNNFF